MSSITNSLIFSKTAREDVNHLNLVVLLTSVDLKKPLKFGSENVLYARVTIAFQCPPTFTGWRAGLWSPAIQVVEALAKWLKHWPSG